MSELYNDRLSARGETCVSAKKKTEKFWNALTPLQRKARAAETILERTKRNRRETGLGISDCDLLGEDMFGWCWCVDDAPARLALYGRARSSRRWASGGCGSEVDAAWPAVGVVPRAPTRGWRAAVVAAGLSDLGERERERLLNPEQNLALTHSSLARARWLLAAGAAHAPRA